MHIIDSHFHWWPRSVSERFCKLLQEHQREARTLAVKGRNHITVLLNAVAQLLLKAGTRTIGHFEFSLANVWPVGWSLATNPYIFGGLSCYAVSVVIWILALSRVEVSLAYPMLSPNGVGRDR